MKNNKKDYKKKKNKLSKINRLNNNFISTYYPLNIINI